jgi:hypothetical protein
MAYASVCVARANRTAMTGVLSFGATSGADREGVYTGRMVEGVRLWARGIQSKWERKKVSGAGSKWVRRLGLCEGYRQPRQRGEQWDRGKLRATEV